MARYDFNSEIQYLYALRGSLQSGMIFVQQIALVENCHFLTMEEVKNIVNEHRRKPESLDGLVKLLKEKTEYDRITASGYLDIFQHGTILECENYVSNVAATFNLNLDITDASRIVAIHKADITKLENLINDLSACDYVGSQFAPLNELGYRQMVCKGCPIEMELFVHRVAEHFGVLHLDATKLASKYTKTGYSFNELVAELKELNPILSMELFERKLKLKDFPYVRKCIQENPEMYQKVEEMRNYSTVLLTILKYQTQYPELTIAVVEQLLQKASVFAFLQDIFESGDVCKEILSYNELHDSTAIVNIHTSFGMKSALMIALQNQKGPHIHYLIKLLTLSGANQTLSSQIHDQNTSLHYACQYQQGPLALEVVLHFLRNGAKECVNVLNKSNFTPLLLTLRYQEDHKVCYDLLEILLESGADPNAVGPQGYTPLMMASRCQRGEHLLKIVKLLFYHGGFESKEQKSTKGWDFLSLAERFQKAKVIHKLIDLCCNTTE